MKYPRKKKINEMLHIVKLILKSNNYSHYKLSVFELSKYAINSSKRINHRGKKVIKFDSILRGFLKCSEKTRF